ncbi:hypothetical protein KZ829_18775 [Actinoplanes hulinensis]|uniref:Serine hydrolase domain-containing protein n=1 Tax=Actinoplanes hulinensis TaxID=1144547 RepID=A0ABS7B437_9ACTN|nr:hypothetical protein [Actinoplanes hulinensis]
MGCRARRRPGPGHPDRPEPADLRAPGIPGPAGLAGGSANAAVAADVTVPVRFVIAEDDERIPRERSLALYDALGSAEKTLHTHPGGHSDPLPDHELDAQVAFLSRHLLTHPQG